MNKQEDPKTKPKAKRKKKNGIWFNDTEKIEYFAKIKKYKDIIYRLIEIYFLSNILEWILKNENYS